MTPVIIFGTGTMARLAWHVFEQETLCSVAGFCVDEQFYSGDEFCGLPVFPAENLVHDYPPDKYAIFIALGYQKLNALRRDVFMHYESLGYRFASCISSRSFIMNGGNIGRNCFILEGTVIQPFSTVGDNCICWSGSVIAHESRIGDHCFLAAHSVVGGQTEIGAETFLGINATVRDAVHVGRRCLIGAGSLVLHDIPDGGVVAEKATPLAPYDTTKALTYISI